MYIESSAKLSVMGVLASFGTLAVSCLRESNFLLCNPT
jgi:hypothetical protein